MLTLRSILMVTAQRRADGQDPLTPHQFGGPEPDNIPMQERIAQERATEKKLTAHWVHTICDQGHYGFTTCSNCGKKVELQPDTCLHCGAVFSEPSTTTPSFGGSDFP